MHTSYKILSKENLVKTVENLHKSGKRIVFTNGCFDIMHAGHVNYLSKARSLGDILVVGLNSDESIRAIKGGKRPIICQAQRAEVLASIEYVDYLCIFNKPDPLRLICSIKPDILVKGADWLEENIIGADFVKKNGGYVARIPLVPGISTTGIIQKIIEIFQTNGIS